METEVDLSTASLSTASLSRIAALKQRIQKEKASLEFLLSARSREHVALLRQGLVGLRDSRSTVDGIRWSLSKLQTTVAGEQTEIPGFEELVQVARVHQRVDAVAQGVTAFRTLPERLDHVVRLLESDEQYDVRALLPDSKKSRRPVAEHLFVIHLHITELEQLRHDALLAVGSSRSGEADAMQQQEQLYATLENIFQPLDQLVGRFERYFVSLAGDLVAYAREGHLSLVVKVAKIVNVEENADKETVAARDLLRHALAAAAQTTSASPQDQPILYDRRARRVATRTLSRVKKRAIAAIDACCHDQVERLAGVHEEQGASVWLEAIEAVVMEDLRVAIGLVAPRLPSDWDAARLYVRAYHSALSDALSQWMQRGIADARAIIRISALENALPGRLRAVITGDALELAVSMSRKYNTPLNEAALIRVTDEALSVVDSLPSLLAPLNETIQGSTSSAAQPRSVATALEPVGIASDSAALNSFKPLADVQQAVSSLLGSLTDRFYGPKQEADQSMLASGTPSTAMQHYVVLVGRKLDEWIGNLLRTESTRFTERSQAPDVDDKEHFILDSSPIVFQMLSQYIDVALDAQHSHLLERVLEQARRVTLTYLSQWTRLLDSEQARHLREPDATPGGLVEYTVAVANDAYLGVESSKKLVSQLQVDLPPLLAQDEDSDPQRFLARIQDIQAAYADLSHRAVSALIDMVFRDLQPATRVLFTPDWTASSVSMTSLIETIKDYMEDYESHLFAPLFDRLVSEILETFLITFLSALTKASRLRMPQSVKRFRDDVVAARGLFSAYIIDADLTAAFDLLFAVESLLGASKQLVVMEYWAFRKKYGAHLDFVEAVLRARGDLDRVAVNDVMGTIRRKVRQEPRQVQIQTSVLNKVMRH